MRSPRNVLLGLLLLGALCPLPAARAGTGTFNFDSDAVNKATTFTDTNNGISATFSSPARPGAYVVGPDVFSPPLTGNQLFNLNSASSVPLDITFAGASGFQFFSLDFVTEDFATPSLLTVTAYAGGLNGQVVGTVSGSGLFPAGGTFPQGSLSLTTLLPFNAIVVSDAAAPFGVDNVRVTSSPAAVPEPSPLALLSLGGVALALGKRRHRA